MRVAVSNVVDDLRRVATAGCEAEECEDAGCHLNMEEIADPWVLVNLDCEDLGLGQVTHADFLLGTQDDALACIELKSGRSISGAVEQIQESSSYAESELRMSEHVIQFRPILGHHVGLKTGQRKYLQRQRIKFQENRHSIRLIPCGGRLVDALRGSV